MRAFRGSGFGVGEVLQGLLRISLGVVCATCGGLVFAEGDDPLILFNRDLNDGVVYSYFDTADPGMVQPVEIARFPPSESSKTLGVFNGILYVDLNKGELAAVDVTTGQRLDRDLCLPENYLHEDGMIYGLPVRQGPDEVTMIDLRGPFARVVPLSPAPIESVSRNVYAGSVDGLRRIYRDAPIPDGERDIVTGHIVDLRTPEVPSVSFRATFPVLWSVQSPHWGLTGEAGPSIAVVPIRKDLDPMRPVWIDRDRFACIALSLEIEDFALEGSVENPGTSQLFVVDLKERTLRVVPLANLPVREPTDPMKGGQDAAYYAFDTQDMKLQEDNGAQRIGELQRLSEHFFASSSGGPRQVMHGVQPLKTMRNTPLVNVEVDQSGERVLLHYFKVAVCYDIYSGYFGETEVLNYYKSLDRRTLSRVTTPPPPGWYSLLDEEASPTSGVTTHASNRRDRGEYYTLAAEASQANYPESSPVSIDVSLTLTGEEGAWTDTPSPAYQVLTGTLAGPANTLALSELAEGHPLAVSAPVFLEAGGKLSYTLTFTPTLPGDYVLALAYGGNPESEWYGRVRAPLVRFSVGDGAVDEHARLRFAIQDFIDRRGDMNDAVFEEIAHAGDAGIKVLTEILLEIPSEGARGDRLPSEAESARWFTISALYGYLGNLRDPGLVPFYQRLLALEDRDLKSEGLSGLAMLRHRSKDSAFRTSIEDIVRDAYANDEPIYRTRAAQRLGVDLFPALYDELKAQVAGADPNLRREALETLATHYLCRREVYAGDTETYTDMMLEEKDPKLAMAAAYCVEQFYSMKTDRPGVQRAIDDYRVRYPEHFGGRFLNRVTDLWDVAWLLRAAGEPTEARLALILGSIPELEKHCGAVLPENFPETWAELQASDAARSAFAITLNAWADCLKETPATFRVPVLKRHVESN